MNIKEAFELLRENVDDYITCDSLNEHNQVLSICIDRHNNDVYAIYKSHRYDFEEESVLYKPDFADIVDNSWRLVRNDFYDNIITESKWCQERD